MNHHDPSITTFEVNVRKESFKFNAAHFVAFPGFRERLHGHNYNIGVRLLGKRKIGHDGYVLDFGDVKKAAKEVCKSINEYFICPMYSDVIDITVTEGKNGDDSSETVHLVCEDGAEFSFPKGDCAMLPLVHSTAEELAIWCWGEILLKLDSEFLTSRGIHTMELSCAEATGQEALFRMEIPTKNDKDEIRRICDVKSYIMTGELFPKPCLPVDSSKGVIKTKRDFDHKGCPHCMGR
mmetsp:Transcript_16756/g.24578  ORF Transcript_16756/g.24578 Transcript_16756/m.24578 type:complete len:237 (-) Transcript_16756:11-721(-)